MLLENIRWAETCILEGEGWGVRDDVQRMVVTDMSIVRL